MDEIRYLVATTNIYIRDQRENVNCLLLKRIALYITDILYIFGAINGPRNGIGFPVNDSKGANVSSISNKLKILIHVGMEYFFFS